MHAIPGKFSAWHVLPLVCVLLGSGAVHAQGSPQQAQQALQKAQGLLRQLAQQKAQADAEVARLRGELALKERALGKAEAGAQAREAALAAAESAVTQGGRREAGLSRDLERTRSRLEQTTAKLREVAQMFKDMRARHAEAEAAREDLAARLATIETALREAEARNLALYRLNQDVVHQYADKSVLDALRQREPFTGIANVAVENAVQDMEDRLAAELLPVNDAAAAR